MPCQLANVYAWGWAVLATTDFGRQSAAADWCRGPAWSGVHRGRNRAGGEGGRTPVWPSRKFGPSTFNGIAATLPGEPMLFQGGVNGSLDIGADRQPNLGRDTWRCFDPDHDVTRRWSVARPVASCPMSMRRRGHDQIPPTWPNPARTSTATAIAALQRSSLIRCFIRLHSNCRNSDSLSSLTKILHSGQPLELRPLDPIAHCAGP
jgi:hypothetical protein